MDLSETFQVVFAIFVVAAGFTWLAFLYWTVRLVKRINVVSRARYRIPENVFWLARSREAIEVDAASQEFVRKRNMWAIAFLAALAGIGVLMIVVAVSFK